MGSSLIFDLSLGEKDIHKSWTFKDILSDPDLEIDIKNRDMKVALDHIAVQNSINNMFLFAKGERIILPEFGNSLYEYLYEPVNDITARKIARGILDMFERWEPRVTIINIFVDAIPDQNTFLIEVEYTIPSLGNDTLVFKTSVNKRR